MEKSGFVYIWRDKKYPRFYIGSHWGSETDGYICSSRWMRNTYKRRPEDFKRRILARVNTSKQDLLIEEGKWLALIPKDGIGKRYYNLLTSQPGHWSADGGKVLSVGEKISKTWKEKGLVWFTDGDRNYLLKEGGDIPEGLVRGMKGGWHHTEILKENRRHPLSYWCKSQTRKKPIPFSEEHRKKIGAASKGNKINLGRYPSEESKKKNSEAHKGQKQVVITCPHCGKRGGNIMRRWHFDNCKEISL